MACRVSHTSFDCLHAYELSEFWKAVLGYRDLDDDPNLPGHEECMIQDPETGHQLLFIEVPEMKHVKNRVHLDLVPTDRRRDDEIERVIEIGAQMIADLRDENGSGWGVMADPEGNEFCILRSDVERS